MVSCHKRYLSFFKNTQLAQMGSELRKIGCFTKFAANNITYSRQDMRSGHFMIIYCHNSSKYVTTNKSKLRNGLYKKHKVKL